MKVCKEPVSIAAHRKNQPAAAFACMQPQQIATMVKNAGLKRGKICEGANCCQSGCILCMTVGSNLNPTTINGSQNPGTHNKMASLDIRTLSFIAMISSLLLAIGLQIVNRVISKDPSLRLWALGATTNGAAFVLLAARGFVPDLLSIIVANTLLVVGASWLYLGNRRFRGLEKETPWYGFVAAVTAAVLAYFTYFTPSLSARIVTLSVATAAVLLPAALVLLRPGDSHDRTVRWFVAVAFLATAIVLGVRAVMTAVMALPGQDFMTVAGPIHTFALVAGIALNVVLGIGLPLLVSGRIQRRLMNNEERNRSLYNHTPAIMHSIDADGKIIGVSDLWLKALGYTRAEVIGRKSSDFLTEESRRLATEKVIPEFFRTGLCVDIPYQLVTKEGRILDMQLSSIAEHDIDKRIVRSLAVMNDVTDRNRIEAALAQSELRFRGAFEAAAHGMALVSTEGRFIKINSALCAMLGYSATELLATDFQSITHPDDLAADVAHVQDLLAGAVKTYQMEKRYFHKTGRIIWIQLSVSLVCTADGTPVHFVAQIQDITQSKSATERLQTLLDTASDGIHVLDQDGNLVQFSQSFARMLGYTAQEAVSLNVLDWDAKIPREQLIPRILSLIKTPAAFETRHRRQDGSVIDVEINAKGIVLNGQAHLYASSRDVTERKLNQQRLEHLLAEQKAMLDNELIGIVKVMHRTIVWANPSFEKMLGYAPGELVGMNTRQNYPSEAAYLAFGAAAYPVLATGGVFRSQIEHVRKNGEVIWVDVSGAILDRETGESLWGFVDVSERRMHEQLIRQSEQRMELALAGADLGLWDLDMSSGRVAHNPRLFSLLGYDASELEMNAQTLITLVHPDDRPQLLAAVEATVKSAVPSLNVEYRVRHKDGHWIWVRCRGKVVERDENGRAVRMTGTIADISERKVSEAKIHELAFYDVLTHLPNRRLFNDRLSQSMARAKREQSRFALLFIDLDKFKPVNDEHGHAVGDWLLQSAAQRIQSCLRASDTAARIGGDEFVVLLPDMQTPDDALTVAEKIRFALQQPLVAPDKLSLGVSCSIGVALYPDHGHTEQDLLRLGDAAMYRAKKTGGNTVEIGALSAGPVNPS